VTVGKGGEAEDEDVADGGGAEAGRTAERAESEAAKGSRAK